MRIVQTLVGIAALAAAGAYLTYGKLSPCGMLREEVRKRDGLAAVLPDSIVDLALAGQYGELSPSRCLAVLINKMQAPPVQIAQASRPQTAQRPPARVSSPQSTPITPQDPLQWAAQMTVRANNECRDKRLRGELATHVASVECSNPIMIAAFNEAHYRYMDLIQFFASRRVELAAKIDRGQMSEQQAQAESQKLYTNIQATEKQRDVARQ